MSDKPKFAFATVPARVVDDTTHMLDTLGLVEA